MLEIEKGTPGMEALILLTFVIGFISLSDLFLTIPLLSICTLVIKIA